LSLKTFLIASFFAYVLKENYYLCITFAIKIAEDKRNIKNEWNEFFNRYKKMIENQQLDKKSLRMVTGKNAAWNDLAKDCVCFANAYGGRILIGIEDDADSPEPSQRIEEALPFTIQKMVQSRTLNVSVLPKKCKAENGG
jgi:Putative DNA-binding domain